MNRYEHIVATQNRVEQTVPIQVIAPATTSQAQMLERRTCRANVSYADEHTVETTITNTWTAGTRRRK
jgi:hypothetical protein